MDFSYQLLKKINKYNLLDSQKIDRLSIICAGVPSLSLVPNFVLNNNEKWKNNETHYTIERCGPDKPIIV